MARRMADLVLAGLDFGDEVGGMDPFGVGAVQMPSLRRASSYAAAAPAASLSNMRQAMVQNAAIAQSLPAVILPVDSGAVLILAGAGFALNVTPVSRVRITRFSVSPAVAGSFILNSILAGRVNIFAGAGSVPADLFAPNSAAPPIEVPLVEAGTIVQVNGTNVSGAAARFIGAFSTIDLTLKLQGQ